MLAIGLHVVTVGVTVVLFVRGNYMARHQADAMTETRHTMLWQNWHTIAQSIGPVTQPHLSEASLATGSEIKRRMEADGVQEQLVAMSLDDSGSEAAATVFRHRANIARTKDKSQDDLLIKELRRSLKGVDIAPRWIEKRVTV
jgi:hypothetical protein